MAKIYGPRQVILVTTREEIEFMGRKKEMDNIITIAWHMPVSVEPFLYAISVNKSSASLQLIKKSKVFVVNFIPSELKDAALFCGKQSGLHQDKFLGAKLTKIDAEHVDCPRIKEAIGYLECHVINEVDAGDHVIFIGEVASQQFKEDKKRLFHLGEDKFTTTN